MLTDSMKMLLALGGPFLLALLLLWLTLRSETRTEKPVRKKIPDEAAAAVLLAAHSDADKAEARRADEI